MVKSFLPAASQQQGGHQPWLSEQLGSMLQRACDTYAVLRFPRHKPRCWRLLLGLPPSSALMKHTCTQPTACSPTPPTHPPTPGDELHVGHASHPHSIDVHVDGVLVLGDCKPHRGTPGRQAGTAAEGVAQVRWGSRGRAFSQTAQLHQRCTTHHACCMHARQASRQARRAAHSLASCRQHPFGS